MALPTGRGGLANAALAVVAAKGLKGLTHRAVDAQAGAAVGTTSNYFRNRAALVAAAKDHVVARDAQLLRQQGNQGTPTSVQELAEQLASAVLALAREHADLTRARFAQRPGRGTLHGCGQCCEAAQRLIPGGGRRRVRRAGLWHEHP
ncbi:hypothetical protein AAHB33_11310 [Paenarthrobacter sp. S56]|uniref:TetR/AcrR family transcriptional regulator n=1 Tax=Paenarthrobacter sp. S56 TaxID=3138179 RepID=UPI00321C1917